MPVSTPPWFRPPKSNTKPDMVLTPFSLCAVAAVVISVVADPIPERNSTVRVQQQEPGSRQHPHPFRSIPHYTA